MRHIGLTGNVAAGKSAVAALFRRWGATVIDADEIVRQLQEPGTPVLAAIARRFGATVLTTDGSLDRARLRSLILNDDTARRGLEARRRGDAVVVSDIPLLFETTDPAEFDAVILVDAPADVRRARLTGRRGLTAAEAERLIAAQQPAGPKRARSTYVIENDADEAALERRARAVWEAVAGA